jgi:hypothetical protein
MRERDQGEGGAHGSRGARGARAGLGRTEPGWAGLGHTAVQNPRHAQPPIGIRSEPKSEMGRDEHATNHDIRQRNMLQHDATPMTFRFCLHVTWTPVTILL